MQETVLFSQRKAAVALCIVLLMLAQQVCAGPLVPQVRSSPEQGADSSGVHTLRRTARMTPLWRIMNSKPFGAYCQNNYECTTGLCRAGHCSTSHRGPSETVNY
ncbi:liver-expressed antimicrobial peptide 2 [Symphorus nematophorus]